MRQEHCGRLLHTASARGEGGGETEWLLYWEWLQGWGAVPASSAPRHDPPDGDGQAREQLLVAIMALAYPLCYQQNVPLPAASANQAAICSHAWVYQQPMPMDLQSGPLHLPPCPHHGLCAAAHSFCCGASVQHCNALAHQRQTFRQTFAAELRQGAKGRLMHCASYV
jgi:hypothetical protein